MCTLMTMHKIVHVLGVHTHVYKACHVMSLGTYLLCVPFCDQLHAELSVGMQTEGVDIRSVGNTQVGDQCEDNSLRILICLHLQLFFNKTFVMISSFYQGIVKDLVKWSGRFHCTHVHLPFLRSSSQVE